LLQLHTPEYSLPVKGVYLRLVKPLTYMAQ
jgi:hypothetical protein